MRIGVRICADRVRICADRVRIVCGSCADRLFCADRVRICADRRAERRPTRPYCLSAERLSERAKRASAALTNFHSPGDRCAERCAELCGSCADLGGKNIKTKKIEGNKKGKLYKKDDEIHRRKYFQKKIFRCVWWGIV